MNPDFVIGDEATIGTGPWATNLRMGATNLHRDMRVRQTLNSAPLKCGAARDLRHF